MKSTVQIRSIIIITSSSSHGSCEGDNLTYQSHRQTGRGLLRTGQNPTWTQRARSNPRKRSFVLVQTYAPKDKSAIIYRPDYVFDVLKLKLRACEGKTIQPLDNSITF